MANAINTPYYIVFRGQGKQRKQWTTYGVFNSKIRERQHATTENMPTKTRDLYRMLTERNEALMRVSCRRYFSSEKQCSRKGSGEKKKAENAGDVTLHLTSLQLCNCFRQVLRDDKSLSVSSNSTPSSRSGTAHGILSASSFFFFFFPVSFRRPKKVRGNITPLL